MTGELTEAVADRRRPTMVARPWSELTTALAPSHQHHLDASCKRLPAPAEPRNYAHLLIQGFGWEPPHLCGGATLQRCGMSCASINRALVPGLPSRNPRAKAHF